MITNLPGRLRNTDLPKTHPLLPVYEAVVNSIQAIEESGKPIAESTIKVEILREPQQSISEADAALPRIIGFRITDDGIGFTDENFVSFNTLDSDRKAGKGGKGIGRLMWLKAFDGVHISSDYLSAGKPCRRTFVFDEKGGVDRNVVVHPSDPQTTGATILLDGFREAYYRYCHRSTDKIADDLFEHCLWFFLRDEQCPQIYIEDSDGRQHLNKVFRDHVASFVKRDKTTIKDQEFTITHVKLRGASFKKHAMALCADGRLVEAEELKGKVTGLFGRLADEQGEFTYGCYVTSPFLNNHVRMERTGFTIVEKSDGAVEESLVSRADIRAAVIGLATAFLGDALLENKHRAQEKVERFVNEVNPRYKPIVSRMTEGDRTIDPDMSDNDLEIYLHRHHAEFERQVLREGQEKLKPKEGEDADAYRTRVRDYLAKVEDIKKSDLAAYVSHRRVVIDLLQESLRIDNAGKYCREEVVHQLIIPMRRDSSNFDEGNSNLWLIDERLAFHDYLASDKTLNSMPITSSISTKEPDICALQLYDTPTLVTEKQAPPFGSLTIVEIKRPMRNDARAGEEKDPIDQCLTYLLRIREGKVTTPNGRPLGNSADTPGFCYIICDITPTIEGRCLYAGLTKTADGLGYFGYNKNYLAYIEVVSFDRLINQAKERNRAFFDKLGLPLT